MNTFLISSAVALVLTSTHLAAGPIQIWGPVAPLEATSVEQLWLARDDKGKGQGNSKATGKGHGNAGHGNRGPDRAQGRSEQPGAGKGRDHSASRAGNTLACIPDYKITHIDDLLPWRWRAGIKKDPLPT